MNIHQYSVLSSRVHSHIRARLIFAAVVFATALGVAGLASASTWAGGSTDWSNNGNPGWNSTGVPNSVGAIADNPITATGTAIQNVSGGVTVGTLSMGGTGNFSWSHTLTFPITFNENGATAGSATISNSNTNTGTTNALILLNGGTITLADDLLISNTGGSTNTTGAIQVQSTVTGAGNVTLSNVSTALTQAGSIRFQTGVNTFTGGVLIKKGTTTFNLASSYGAATNVITLGENGQGSAVLLSSTAVTLANPITVASGSVGTLTLGTTSTASTGTFAYSGDILLNGSLQISSGVTTTNGVNLTGAISGAGGISKIGSGIFGLSEPTNSYAGDTVINAGTMITAASSVIPEGVGKGNVNLANSGTLWIMGGNEVVNGLFGAFGSTIRSNSTSTGRTITVGADNSSSAYSGVLNNNTTAVITLVKMGTGLTVLNGNAASTSLGSLRPEYNGGTLRLDFANFASSSDLMNAGMTLSAFGGTFELLGKSTGSTSQTFAALNLFQSSRNFGHDTTVLVSPNNGTGTTLAFTSPTLSRQIGNTVNLAVGTGTGNAIINLAAANTNGIIGGFAVYNSNTWAVGGTPLTGLDSSLYSKTSVLGTSAANYNSLFDVASNVDVDFVASIGTPSLNLDGGITVNSLRFNTAQTQNVELALQGTNTLNSGGLLVTSAVGNHAVKISGGTLAGNGSGTANPNGSVTTAADLIVQQRNSANIVEISSTIVDGSAGITGLTKAGNGTLKLSANNTYSGSTYAANGALVVGTLNAIPHGAGKGNVLVSGTLDANGNNITLNGLEIRPSGVLRTGVAGSVTVGVGENNEAVTFNAGATVQDGAGVLSIEKLGTGTFISSAQVTYSGGTTLSSGTLSFGASSTPIAGTVTSGPVGTGTLTLAGGTLNAAASTAGATIANAVKTNGTVKLDSTSSSLNMTLAGPLTSTSNSDVINLGSSTGSVFITGDVSGFYGTFNQNLNTTNTLSFLVNDVNASNARIALSGAATIGSSNRYMRFGNSALGTTASIKIGELSGAGLINPSAGGLSLLNMEIGNLNTDVEFSGSILGRGSQTFNLTKVGTGELTLSGASSYGGNVNGKTTVSAGTLVAGDNVPAALLNGTLTTNAVTGDTLSTAAPHGLSVGDRVTYQGTIPSGLTAVNAYYVVAVPSATEYKVSATPMGAPISNNAQSVALVAQMGAFGAQNTPVFLGDANTGSNNVALLTGGPFEIERAVSVTSNGSGTATIGGKTADNSTFSGAISLAKNVNLTSIATGGSAVNMTGVISSSGPFGVTKMGSGDVVLSGANTYTGDTKVQEGTLSLTNAFLANAASVFLTTGSILNLNFAGTDSINGLFIDAMAQATGTWGRVGSGANHESSLITGNGLLSVGAVTLAGDYNGDNKVDAADYVLWRRNPGLYGGDPGGYNTWRQNFGNSQGSGSGLGGITAVPEPATLGALAVGLLMLVGSRRASRR